MTKMETGDMIVAVLREPHEKVGGVLGEINTAGIFMRGIDLNAFEDFSDRYATRKNFIV